MDFGSLGDAYKNEDAPNYTIGDSRLYTAIFVAAVLMSLTIVGALFAADTVVAEFVLSMYQLFWALGAVVIGVPLTLGMMIGLSGIESQNKGMAFVGVLLSIIGYSAFGGAILTPYESSSYFSALVITGVVTVAIALIWSLLVFVTDWDFSWAGKAAGGCFIVGIGLIIVASFITALQIVAYAVIVIAFIFELGYEIWMTSRSRRSPIANGFAIYFAFAGVFFHLLQLALEHQ